MMHLKKNYNNFTMWFQCIFLGLQFYLSHCYFEDLDLEEVNWQQSLIPPNYKPNWIPSNFIANMPLEIKIRASFEAFVSISETAMEFTANMFASLKWEDARLNFSVIPESRKNSCTLLVKHLKFWRPPVFVANSRVRDRDIFTDTRSNAVLCEKVLEVYSWFTVRIFCPFEFYDYPFDVQLCSVRFQCDIDPRDVVLIFDQNYDESVILQNSPSLLLEIHSINRGHCSYITNHSTFTCLALNVVFKRRLTTHIAQTFLPSILIVILSWFSFWLDVDAAPARISLGVTALLTLVTSFAQTQYSLPSVSYMKAIDLWMFVCVLSVFLSLVEFTAAYTAEKSKMEMKQKQQLVRNIHVQKPFVIKIPSHPKRGKMVIMRATRLWAKVKKLRKFYSVDKLARISFPSSFILFTLSFWIYYLEKARRSLNNSQMF